MSAATLKPSLDRLPPHSEMAEYGLIKSCLLAPQTAVKYCIQNGVVGDCFYLLTNRLAWSALIGLYCEHPESIDSVTLFERLNSEQPGKFSLASFAEYTDALDKDFISTANLSRYVEIVIEKWILRKSVQLFTESAAQIYEANASIPDLIVDTREIIQHLEESAIRLSGNFNGSSELTVRSPDEILNMQFDDSDCILGDRLLAKAQSLVIAGQGGAGKSRLAIQLAVSCITGHDFVGIKTHNPNLRWLILQVENSNRRLHHDLQALRTWCNGTWDKVQANMMLHTVETDTDNFVALENSENFWRVSRTINDFNPDVVIFDSLYNFTSEDINTDQGMAGVCSLISKATRRGNPHRCPVIVHHAITGKFGAAKAVGYDRSSFARNSKVLLAWTRGQINVAPGFPDNNDTLVLACGKNSNGREFTPFAVSLDPDTMIYRPDEHFDMVEWQSSLSGSSRTKPIMSADRVAELCKDSMTKSQLAHAIQDDCGCGRTCAFNWVVKSEQSGKICLSKLTSKFFCPP